MIPTCDKCGKALCMKRSGESCSEPSGHCRCPQEEAVNCQHPSCGLPIKGPVNCQNKHTDLPASTGGERCGKCGGEANVCLNSGKQNCADFHSMTGGEHDFVSCPKCFLDVPVPKPSTEEEGWEKEFRNRFGNYGLYQDEEYVGIKDVLEEVVSFVRSALSRQAESFQKKLWEARLEGVMEAKKAIEAHEKAHAKKFNTLMLPLQIKQGYGYAKDALREAADKIRKGL